MLPVFDIRSVYSRLQSKREAIIRTYQALSTRASPEKKIDLKNFYTVPYSTKQFPQFKMRSDFSMPKEFTDAYNYWTSESGEEIIQRARMISPTVGIIYNNSTHTHSVLVFISSDESNHVGFAFVPSSQKITAKTEEEVISHFELTRGVM